MLLVLQRHGHDLPDAKGTSVLSAQGRSSVRANAETLASTCLSHFRVGISSPSARCRETLQEMSQHLSIGRTLVSDQLSSGSDPRSLEALLLGFLETERPPSLLIVGHEPQLTNSVLSWLGQPDDSSEPSGPRWTLSRGECMYIAPEVLGSTFSLHARPVLSSARTFPYRPSTPSTCNDRL